MATLEVSYIGAFIAGLLSFLSPCVLPLIPSYISYITGISFADLQSETPTHQQRRKTLLHSISFITGFTVVFVLLGASATLFGSYFKENSAIISKIGGVLLVILGLHIAGIIRLKFLMGYKRANIAAKPAGYAGSFFIGLVFAAGWTPCIGPILAAILTVAATGENPVQGVVLLLIYSLGLGVPFFLSSLAINRFLSFFNNFKKHYRAVEIVTGLFLVLIGVSLFFNWLSQLSIYLTQMLS